MPPRWSLRSWLLGGLLAAAVAVPGVLLLTRDAWTNPPPARPAIWGYYPWWLGDHWRTLDLRLYDGLRFFEVGIDDDARLAPRNGWPQQWEPLREAARVHRLPLEVTVTMFSAARFERVFADPARRRVLLAELLRLAAGARGLHLDVEIFERVSDAAVAGYRAFCAQLRAGLRGVEPAVALSAFGVMGAAVDLYDAATLAQLDQIVLQGYDSHHRGSAQAGPVAPLRGPFAITWESTLAHYLKLGAPRHKIVFGLPFYGYEWPTASADVGARALGQGREISYALLDEKRLPAIRIGAREQAARHGFRRDEASGSPYYVYREAPGGGWRQGWFEDEVSLAAKLEFVRRERLAGVAVFPVGYDGGAFEGLLRRFRGR
jgi:spore germination protein YaaH